MLGYEVDALPADAELWARLMHPDDHDRVAAQLRAWLEGDASQYQIEFRLQHQAGGYVTVLSRGFVKRDAAGKAVRVSGTNTDITARRALEEKLRQSQKMEAVGQLAGGVAHDFNNLLSIILGNLDLVRHHLGDVADARESLGHAVAACRRGAELTRRLLSFSRQQPLAHEAVELGALLPGLGTVLRRLIPESIHIDVRLAADLPRVVIDPAMLENALLNLAINARDAMPTGGTLTFSAAAEDGRVRLAVSDTGTGMSPEVRERALEPFFTTQPTGQGTGLGLSMVYGFVQQSGGSLQLRSAPGEGTTVVLDLPASGAAAFVHPPEVPLPISAGPRDEVVLVVEDEPGVRRLCVQALEHLGFRTVSSADGPDALEVLAMLPRVDLLLTDVVMPGGLSGLDLAAAAQARRPDLKVIFMSGYLPDSFDPASRARIRPLLPKPFTASELSRLVSEVLGGQPRREG
jgi:PAS domain S-box-containing protein